MLMGKEQERRLMELLGKLAARDAGEPTPDMERAAFRVPDFNGQEHNDAKTLAHMGWIRSRRGFGDIANSWSGEGIYAFDLTDDGRAVFARWNELQGTSDGDAEALSRQATRPFVMMVHGSQDGRVPDIVNQIRLWCFERGLDAYKAADIPNTGRFLNQKMDDVTNSADYYVVVLTPDDELASGIFQPRPNALMEMARLLDRNPSKVCVLKDDTAIIPSDYVNLVTEHLANWESVLMRELKAVDLL